MAALLVRNFRETAWFFGITPRELKDWLAAGCPCLTGGDAAVLYTFDLHAVTAWRATLPPSAFARPGAYDGEPLTLDVLAAAVPLPTGGVDPSPVSGRVNLSVLRHLESRLADIQRGQADMFRALSDIRGAGDASSSR